MTTKYDPIPFIGNLLNKVFLKFRQFFKWSFHTFWFGHPLPSQLLPIVIHVYIVYHVYYIYHKWLPLSLPLQGWDLAACLKTTSGFERICSSEFKCYKDTLGYADHSYSIGGTSRINVKLTAKLNRKSNDKNYAVLDNKHFSRPIYFICLLMRANNYNYLREAY